MADNNDLVFLKPALTYNQQLDKLINEHKLVIHDRKKARSILKEVNYYRLSGYGITLRKPGNEDEYVEGTTLEQIYRLYNFDSEFRNCLFHVLEQLEVQLRTQIAYYLGKTYGPLGYMDIQNFNPKKAYKHQKVMESLVLEIDQHKNFPYVVHYKSKYHGHFPIWVAVELFSFGSLRNLYQSMKWEDKCNIANLYNQGPERFSNWFMVIVDMRNSCAHYDRLYGMNMKTQPSLHQDEKQYASTSQVKVFGGLLIVKHLLKNDDRWKEYLKQLKSIMGKYQDVVDLNCIGFPEDWYEVLSR